MRDVVKQLAKVEMKRDTKVEDFEAGDVLK